MLRKTYTLCLFGLMGMILMAVPVRAQMSGNDFILNAVLNDNNVNLSWESPANFSVSYYIVFKAQVSAMAMLPPAQTGWTMIDSTKDTGYVDTSTPARDTAFVYVVKAYNSSMQSISSSVAVVFVNPFSYHRDHVTITSVPPLYATLDSLYAYKVKAVSDSTTAVLHYRLGEHPDSMTIDSTGLITWMPKLSGYRDVEIIVTSSLGGAASQEYVVRVARFDATISGAVADTLGHPLPHVIIHVYRTAMPLVVLGASFMPAEFFDYMTESDSAGNYRIPHVDAGRYFVQAVPLNPNYLPEWYNNVQNLKDATPVAVTTDSTYTATFALKNRFYHLPKFVISGTVSDTTGAGIGGAAVVFARAGYVFNDAKEDLVDWTSDENFRDFFGEAIHDGDVDHRFSLDNVQSPYVLVTLTDGSGTYKDTLPEGNYVIFARAKGYYKTFFNNKVNLLTADVLSLTSDTTNINFTMYTIPSVELGQISGSVIDSTSGAGVPARMIAFRDIWSYKDTLKIQVPRYYFADADTTGSYTFTDLPPGYYKILALPLGSYAPSFYSQTGPTVRWKQATAVQLDGTSISGANIYVMPIPDSISGYASISGRITSAAVNSSGVGGAVVYSTDAIGNINGYGITNADGSYTINGVAQGSFNVFTDAIGFTSNGSGSSNTTYNSDGSATSGSANLSVTPELPLAVKAPTVQPTSYSLKQNYPNPFNPTTQIAFNIAQTERVNISIFNILGQKVATIVDADMSSGAHVMVWNGRNQHGELLPSGVYFYRLSTPSFSAVKKMILLK